MRIKIISDFHTEFWTESNPPKFARLLEKYLPTREDDKDTVLVCAGDMGTYKTYATSYKLLFNILSKRFRAIVCVPGNHSWYYSIGVWGNEAEFWKGKKVPKNVHYLNNDYIVIDEVVFFGSALWTSFNNFNPVSMFHAQRSMNDFMCIKRGYRVTEGPYVVSETTKLLPEQTAVVHQNSVQWLKTAFDCFRDFKKVVVTHHAPSPLSVSEYYRGDILNDAYYTDLTELIIKGNPLIWTHGHMHDSKRYTVGDTEVICNPLGYHPQQLNRKFDPELIVEV